MRKILFISTATMMLLITSSCSVKKYVNEKFPKLTTIDQQYNAIAQNLKHIDSLEPSIGVFVSEDLLMKTLPNSLKETIENSDSEELIVNSFETNLSLKKQAIGIEGEFDITLPEHFAVIKGKMNGTSAVSAVSDSIYIRTAFQSLRIRDISFTQKPGIGKRALAKLIVPLLRNFIERVNGQYLKKPSVIDASWKETVTFDPKSLFQDDNTSVSGPVVNIERYLEQSSILISKEGLSILIELSNQDNEANADNQLVTNGHTQSELNGAFSQLDSKYKEKWNEIFSPISGDENMSIALSKKEVASIFNESLSAGFQLKTKVNIPKETFNSKIQFDKDDINCNKVKTKFSFPKFSGSSCSWDCAEVWGVPVDPFCESSKLACKAARETARIAWQASRETARIAHQGLNASAVLACEAIKTTTGLAKLGRLKGGVSGDGSGKLKLSNFTFSDDLTRVDFKSKGDVNLDVNTTLELKPRDLGYIFLCSIDYKRKITSKADFSIPSQSASISLTSSKDGDKLKLGGEFSKLDYDATLFPSPLHVYLLDPELSLKCPVFAGTLALASGAAATASLFKMIDEEAKIILFGRTSGSYQPNAFSNTFEPITFDIDSNSKIKSEVFWKEKSIEFLSTKQ